MTPGEVIQRLDQGHFSEDLTAAIVAVAEDVVRTGKKGSVAVTFEITQPNAGEPAVIVMDSISRKPPKEAGRGTMAFVIDGELHRNDPRQTSLPVREVDLATGEIVEHDLLSHVREG